MRRARGAPAIRRIARVPGAADAVRLRRRSRSKGAAARSGRASRTVAPAARAVADRRDQPIEERDACPARAGRSGSAWNAAQPIRPADRPRAPHCTADRPGRMARRACASLGLRPMTRRRGMASTERRAPSPDGPLGDVRHQRRVAPAASRSTGATCATRSRRRDSRHRSADSGLARATPGSCAAHARRARAGTTRPRRRTPSPDRVRAGRCAPAGTRGHRAIALASDSDRRGSAVRRRSGALSDRRRGAMLEALDARPRSRDDVAARGAGRGRMRRHGPARSGPLLRSHPMKGLVLAGGTATPAVPAHDRHQQAPAADLRPADDLLPARHARRDGDPRGDGHRRRQERRRHRRAAGRRPALRPRPHLPLPARRARDRPRDRPGAGLHRRRRVLRGPGRQHPAGRAARGRPRSELRAGRLRRRHAPVPRPRPGAVRRRGAGRARPGDRVRGEAAAAQERPDPDRRLLPAPGRVRRHRPTSPRRAAASSRSPTCSTTTSRAAGCSPRSTRAHWADAGTVPSLLRAAELAEEDDHAGRLAAAGRAGPRSDRPPRRRRRTSWSPAAPGSSARSWSAGPRPPRRDADHGPRQAHLRGQPRQPRGRRARRRSRPPGSPSSRATSPTRTVVDDPSCTRPTRSSTSPPRPTSTARSSTPRRSCAPASSASTSCSRRSKRATERRPRDPRSSRSAPTRSTATSPTAASREADPARPAQPVRRGQGRRRAPGPRLPRDLRGRHGDHPRLQHVRPAPAPREADPAVHDQRPRRRAAADVRRRDAGPRLAPRRATTPPGSTSCSGHGAAGRGLQRRRRPPSSRTAR